MMDGNQAIVSDILPSLRAWGFPVWPHQADYWRVDGHRQLPPLGTYPGIHAH